MESIDSANNDKPVEGDQDSVVGDYRNVKGMFFHDRAAFLVRGRKDEEERREAAEDENKNLD